MDGQEAVQSIVNGLILTLDGFLVILYGLWDHLPTVLTWGLAAGVVRYLDLPTGQTAGFRPLRYGRGSVQMESPAYLGTLCLAALWTAVGLMVPPPVPWIGVALWGCLLIVPLYIQLERKPLRDRIKWFLGVYGLACLGFLVLLRTQLSGAALAAWSRTLGRTGGGEMLEATVVSSFTPYAALMLWIVGPLLIFGYIAQRFAVYTRTDVSPHHSPESRIRALRTRGED